MKIFSSLGGAATVLCAVAGTLLPATAPAQSTQQDWEAEKWQFTASIYGWVPTIDSTVNFPDDARSTDLHVSKSDLLNHLKMTFQGSLDAHHGRWGIFNDVVYVDLGGSKSATHDFSIGNFGVPASVTTDLSLGIKAVVWTVAGEYRIVSDPTWTLDLLGGARMLWFKPTVGYSITGDLGPIVIPGREGSTQVDETLWDGIIGLKGRYTFGNDRRWYAPYYLDVGTGQAELTWQIAGGIGYSFDWGSVFAMWRYLDYNLKSGNDVEDFNMNGPMVGVAFQF